MPAGLPCKLMEMLTMGKVTVSAQIGNPAHGGQHMLDLF